MSLSLSKSNLSMLLFALGCFQALSQTQTYRVIDSEGHGIAAVVVASKTDYVITDSMGCFTIANFKPDDTLTFSHIGYKTRLIALLDLPSRLKLELESTTLRGLTVAAASGQIITAAVVQDKLVLNAETISFAAAQTTADLLNFSGEVSIQKSQQGGGSPMLRGFAANRILLVLDGVKMNNAIYRSGNLHNLISVDNQSLGQVEVLFGASSLLYGSGGLGGTIRLQTFRPNFKSFKINTLTRYTYNNQELTGHMDFNLGSERLASFTSFTWSDFGDLRAGKTRLNGSSDFGKRLFYVENAVKDSVMDNPQPEIQISSGYRQWNILQKLRYKFNSRHELAYTFHYTNSSEVPRYDQLQRQQDSLPRFAEWFYGPQRWQFHQLQTKHHFTTTTWIDLLETSFAYQKIDEDRFDRRFKSRELRKRFEDVASFSFNLNAQKKYKKFLFLSGLEATYNRVNSLAFRENIVTGRHSTAESRYPDGGSDYYSFAFHFNQKWEFHPQAVFNAGLRYDHILIYTNFKRTNLPFDNFKVNTGAWTGGLHYTYSPQSWRFKIGFATAFRAPNVDDIAKVFESGEGVMVVPNPNLSSEYSYQFESSIRKVWSTLSLDLVGFYNHVEGLMVRRNFTFQNQTTLLFDNEEHVVQAIVNAGQAYIGGFTTRLDWALTSHLHFLSNFTFLRGKDKTTGVALRHVAPPFGKTTFLWQKKKYRISLNTQYSGGITFQNLAPSEQNKPYLYDSGGALSWWTLNAKAQFNFSKFKILIHFENLLDLHYRPYASGISAGGRSFSLTLKWNFG